MRASSLCVAGAIALLCSVLSHSPALAASNLAVDAGQTHALLSWQPNGTYTSADVCWKRTGLFWGACSYNETTVSYPLPAIPPTASIRISELDCGTEYKFKVRETWFGKTIKATTLPCSGTSNPPDSGGCTVSAVPATGIVSGLALLILGLRRRR